jgi:hypothetical protein
MPKKTQKSENEKMSLQSGFEAGSPEEEKSNTKSSSKKSQAFVENIITDSETAKERGKKGGIKSGEVRRENAQRKKDAREAVRYMLELPAKNKLKSNLQELGYPEDECTNMAALVARLFTAAIQTGNLDSFFALMKMAGYDPEEERKERESLAADKRRELELDAKIAALGQRGPDAGASIFLDDEDDNNDVVIYMPQVASEESRQMPPESEPNNEESITEEEE